MKQLRGETTGLMMRLGWPNVRMLSCIFGFVLLTESIGWLDLVPILLLIPWTVVIGGFVFLFAIVAFPFVWLQWRSGGFRYSTRTLLLLACMVAWPVSRLTEEVRVERRRVQVQQQCVEMLMNLRPPGGQILMSGRYNDGHAGGVLQRGLCQIAFWGIKANRLPYEICHLTSLDLTNSAIEDDQLILVAKTQTVSEINLASTKITDAGLEHIHELSSLRFLKLTNTSVSKPAIEALKKRFPNLNVEQ